MTFSHIPPEYRPEAVRLRAIAITETLTGMAARAHDNPAAKTRPQQYINQQIQEQDQHVNTLLKTAAETAAASRLNKGRYMLEITRSVLSSDYAALADKALSGAARHAIVNLGLAYLARRPQAFLAALSDNPRLTDVDFERIAAAITTAPQSQASDLIKLPAPAALALLGITNSLNIVLKLQAMPPAR